MTALNSEIMPPSVCVTFLAIVASNIHNSRVFWWKWLESYIHCNTIPNISHIVVSCSLLTDGTADVVNSHLVETVPVDIMPTWHFMTSASAGEEVFVTYRAIGRVFAFLTIVVIEKVHINTHATSETVLEIVPASYSTESTIGTMIGLFVCFHP
jgi:hypothetical protein